MITVREASGPDVPAIRDIFLACYGTDYPFAEYYDEQALNKLVYSDNTLLLVAEDSQTQRVLGTASVILEAGAYSDLVGEFGRLAVHPDARQRGVGRLLMSERLRRVQDRLQVGLVEARLVHPYSLRIAESHQFAPVGLLPLKTLFRQRESFVLLARYFGSALELRRNHPRVIPEVYPLAHLALANHSLRPDVIIDEDAPSYPPCEAFQVEELTTEGYSSLLRIERGRVRHREIFGRLRLHYGFFKLQARKSRYLIAREEGRIAGAIGFTFDEAEKVVCVFELISLHDHVIRFLLSDLVRRCREEWMIRYIEVDTSAHAPRMQRTLVELGFLPVAYVPALVFHEVERLDVVKMVQLCVPLEATFEMLTPRAQALADLVVRQFQTRSILPRIAEAVRGLPLFEGLDAEQINRLAGVCKVANFEPEDVIFRQGDASQELYVVLDGEVAIRVDSVDLVGSVSKGECLGEISLVTAAGHSATATARTRVEMAILAHRDLTQLIRQRPDIGLHLYRNVAAGMAAKLKRSNLSGPGSPAGL